MQVLSDVSIVLLVDTVYCFVLHAKQCTAIYCQAIVIMLLNLSSVLNWSSPLPTTSKSLLIADTVEANGRFVIAHFIMEHVKSERPLCYISLSTLLNHYVILSQKMVSQTAHVQIEIPTLFRREARVGGPF
jgi:hypothetical protein